MMKLWVGPIYATSSCVVDVKWIANEGSGFNTKLIE